MLEQIEKIETTATELQSIIDKENEILTKLFVAAKGYLAGRWKKDDSYQCQWEAHDLKVKVNGYHLLGDVNAQHSRIYLSLVKSTIVSHKTKKFRNDEIATSWKVARSYVSLTQVVDVVLDDLRKKLDEAKKLNLQDISDRVDQVN